MQTIVADFAKNPYASDRGGRGYESPVLQDSLLRPIRGIGEHGVWLLKLRLE
ncbi:hypothetical protein RMSM_04013 [Rhodopirellula maiorica SM1]|uniref:Uncharacterized protein n=1 Tax=Rhodopirellula maiorica SM1 TaxID=1265738 RepID=M5RUJ1_9BACT|nr:hypothetical protein RMSM_04013 [Rhodopirellula maiorica SM1]